MDDKEFYSQKLFCDDATDLDGMSERNISALEKLNGLLLKKFTEKVFPRTAAAYGNRNNLSDGLRSQFGKVSVAVDEICGQMLVTLRHSNEGTMVTFGAYKGTLGLFHNPAIVSYLGRPKDMSLMVDQVAQGIKRGKREGRRVFRGYPVVGNMYEELQLVSDVSRYKELIFC